MCEVIEAAGCILGVKQARGGFVVVEIDAAEGAACQLAEGDCILEVEGTAVNGDAVALSELAAKARPDSRFLVDRRGEPMLLSLTAQESTSATSATPQSQDLLKVLQHFKTEGQRMEAVAKQQYTLRVSSEEENVRLKAQLTSLKNELNKRDQHPSAAPLGNCTNTLDSRKASPSKRLERQNASDLKRLRSELLAAQRKVTALSQENAHLKQMLSDEETRHAQELICVRSARSGEGERAMVALRQQNESLRAALEVQQQPRVERSASPFEQDVDRHSLRTHDGRRSTSPNVPSWDEKRHKDTPASAAPEWCSPSEQEREIKTLKDDNEHLRAELSSRERSAAVAIDESAHLGAVRNCLIVALEKIGVEVYDESIEGLTEALVAEASRDVGSMRQSAHSMPRTAEEYFEGAPSFAASDRESPVSVTSPELNSFYTEPVRDPSAALALGCPDVASSAPSPQSASTHVSFPHSHRSPPQPVRHPSLSQESDVSSSRRRSPPQPTPPSWVVA